VRYRHPLLLVVPALTLAPLAGCQPTTPTAAPSSVRTPTAIRAAYEYASGVMTVTERDTFAVQVVNGSDTEVQCHVLIDNSDRDGVRAECKSEVCKLRARAVATVKHDV
jgi:hypothetical protein